jgi:hypothetical protein
VLRRAAEVVGLLLEWGMQGDRAARWGRELLAGAGALLGPVHDTRALFAWVDGLAGRLCGGGGKLTLLLLDPETGELHHTAADGSRSSVWPSEGSLAGRAVRSGDVVMLGGVNAKGEGSAGRQALVAALAKRGAQAVEEEAPGLEARAGAVVVCYPLVGPGGRVLGALEVCVPVEGEGVAALQVDVEGLEQVVQLLGVAVERLHSRVKAAARIKVRAAHALSSLSVCIPSVPTRHDRALVKVDQHQIHRLMCACLYCRSARRSGSGIWRRWRRP